MQYYKEQNKNTLYAYEEGVNYQDYTDKVLTEITLADYEALIAPTAEELLQQAKDNQLQAVNSSFDNILSTGFATSILDANSVAITMDSTYDDITKVKAGYDLAILVGATDMIVRDFSNINHTLVLTDVSTIVAELGSNFQLELTKLWGYKDSINSATTLDEVAAIVWS